MTKPTRQCKKLLSVLGVLLFVFVWLCPYEVRAQAAQEYELNIKSGFIYNFALFDQWPAKVFADINSPLAICIAGNAETVAAFEQLKTKKITNRPVTVYAFGDNATHHPCH
ncbi:MAG: YfiR family protein, partial [Proteobacteria bacterium]|nr:YfiR family protein [Pseudomonadota bacterium]